MSTDEMEKGDSATNNTSREATVDHFQSNVTTSEHRTLVKDSFLGKAATADIKPISERSTSISDNEEYPTPTREESKNLRKVADSIPVTAWLLCVVELAERASYYGVNTVFSNFMQFPLPKGGNGAGAVGSPNQTAGALGKGLQFSNAFVLLFSFLAYIIPIYGGYLADTKLGRFKTILIGVLICGVSHVIMIVGAIPKILQEGNGIAPFLISLFLLAIGAGLFKPNIAPTVLDQYRHQKQYIRTLPSGERVVVDPEVTVQRVMLIFYGFINIGAFFAIATSYSEKYVGFWLAYLLPGIVYFLLPALLWYLYPRLTKYPPDGSALAKVWKIVTVSMKQTKGQFWKHESFWQAARPSVLAASGVASFNGSPISWSDKDVDDVRRTMLACAIFLYFPIYNLNDGGIGSVSTSMGSTLTTNGAPNDLLNNFNPLTIIVVVPILSYVVYPTLRHFNIPFGRITRITFGFAIATISGIIGAVIQYRIYKTSPCGYAATGCENVSPISVWVQVPIYSLGALSECFCNVTAYELAYARSPPGMKALVMSIFLAMTALSKALGEIISPAIKDPYLVWIWAGPAIALAVQTVIFWIRYRKFNDDDFMTSEDADLNDEATEKRTSEEAFQVTNEKLATGAEAPRI
ncbi:putative proton-dependent oligopeptide transporter family, MFS transporter superfamily [Septoria linicola]|nr:putative proton-dependent oligopeptide transporter family, MFS transporter superfamily [Septoria linicola]